MAIKMIPNGRTAMRTSRAQGGCDVEVVRGTCIKSSKGVRSSEIKFYFSVAGAELLGLNEGVPLRFSIGIDEELGATVLFCGAEGSVAHLRDSKNDREGYVKLSRTWHEGAPDPLEGFQSGKFMLHPHDDDVEAWYLGPFDDTAHRRRRRRRMRKI